MCVHPPSDPPCHAVDEQNPDPAHLETRSTRKENYIDAVFSRVSLELYGSSSTVILRASTSQDPRVNASDHLGRIQRCCFGLQTYSVLWDSIVAFK